MTGYGHEAYACSLSAFGEPLCLPRAEGWGLLRPIGSTGHRDAIGCYPLLLCRRWGALGEDLDALGGSIVSFACVADPFGDCSPDLLRACFPDRCGPFKPHFAVDLSKPMQTYVSAHHRRNARFAQERLSVERVAASDAVLADWLGLYAHLTARHSIAGMARFGPDSFRQQFAVPGMEIFRAAWNGETTGMVLWMLSGRVGYYHLAAYSERGYEMKASFALFETSIRHFQDSGLAYLNLGGAPGVDSDPQSGLARFKKGWASETRVAHFCGRVMNRPHYEALASARAASGSSYFPAYRQGDFH